MKTNNQKISQGYVIGIDGGGTTTTVAMADLQGKILSIKKSGPSSPRNIGIKISVENISQAIEKVLEKARNRQILSTFIGLPAVEEEFKSKKDKIKKEFLKDKEISLIFQGKIIIGSDQIVSFRSGSDKKDGVLLIAGTGSVAHGWREGKEAKASGWGWLADEGSAFWVGQKGFQAILKDLDGRSQKTLISQIVFQKLKVKNREDLIQKIYLLSPRTNSVISSLSISVNEAAKKEDKIAKFILVEAGRELALAVNSVVEKLNFQKINFPLVLTGSMLESKVVLKTVKREVKKFAPRAEFIRPKNKPVAGAIKLAIEALKLRK